MPAPVLDEIESALQVAVMLRLALNTLQSEMPAAWETGSVYAGLETLRENLRELELREIRRLGPQEYLLIKPLAPDAGGKFAEQAAGHVRALDDLGLVVRLVLCKTQQRSSCLIRMTSCVWQAFSASTSDGRFSGTSATEYGGSPKMTLDQICTKKTQMRRR
jgi:hypothetical protein